MGLYDMFHGECPFCKADYIGQSKFFGCEMQHFDPGSKIATYSDSMRLEMKERCIECRNRPIAVIEEGVFKGFEKDRPTSREGYWGACLDEEEDRQEAYDEMIKDAMEADED